MLEKKNSEGYTDMTAYLAIKRTEGVKEMEAKRGEIWEIEKGNGEKRQVLILAADDSMAAVYLLLDRYKPGEIEVQTLYGEKYLHPLMVGYVTHYSMVRFVQTLREEKLKEIETAFAKAFGEFGEQDNVSILSIQNPVLHADEGIAASLQEELSSVKKEAEIYKGLYDDLLGRLLK